MGNLLTPIKIIENFFNMSLRKNTLEKFSRVSQDKWISFAKYYLSEMKDNFKDHHLVFSETEKRLRIYFEPVLYEEYGSVIQKKYSSTPLLGLNPVPANNSAPLTSRHISTLLNPLKKHLLIADSIYLRDNFYYCFDAVADSVDKGNWRRYSNIESLVNRSINSIKSWLPILVEIRELIETKAIIFMPYYLTPSFPFNSRAPHLAEYWDKIIYRNPLDEEDFDYRMKYWKIKDDCKLTWLNSRLLNLTPVYPNKQMFKYASGIQFIDELTPISLTSDLTSLSVLPFGNQKDISLKELIKIRKNEEIFSEVGKTVIELKEMIEKENLVNSTQKAINFALKGYLKDRLSSFEKGSIIEFINHPATGIAFSFSVGVMMISADPLIGLLSGLGTSVTPSLLKKILESKEQKALGHIQMLL